MGGETSKNLSADTEQIKRLLSEIVQEQRQQQTKKSSLIENKANSDAKHTGDIPALQESLITELRNVPKEAKGIALNKKAHEAKFIDAVLLKYKSYMDKSNFCLVPDKYLSSNFECGKVIPSVNEKYTSLFPDQIPDDVLIEYLKARGKIIFEEIAKKDYLHQLAELKPQRIKNSDFQALLTQTALSVSIFPMNELSFGAEHYIKLFELDSMDYLMDEYYLIDTTIMRLLAIKKENDLWIAPSVVLLKKESIDANRLDIVAIAIENFNHIDDGIFNAKFPDTLKNLKLVYPNDGLAWEMAKLHTALNMKYWSITCQHTKTHLTLSNPISIASLALRDDIKSKDSIVASLFATHTYLQVPLDSLVLHHKLSVLHAVEADYYAWNNTPDQGGILHMFTNSVNGWANHPIYQPCGTLFFNKKTELIGKYPTFLCSIKSVVTDFIENIFKLFCNDPNEIEFMKIFKRKLWDVLPTKSFLRDDYRNIETSDGTFNMAQLKECMKKLLSFIIYNSIEHSLEHCTNEEKNSWMYAHLILRKPVPLDKKSRETKDYSLINKEIESINTVEDRVKFYISMSQYFENHSPLTYADFYADGGHFKTCRHSQAESLRSHDAKFYARLEALFDTDVVNVSLKRIGISIQT
jgi:hypothetical protein